MVRWRGFTGLFLAAVLVGCGGEENPEVTSRVSPPEITGQSDKKDDKANKGKDDKPLEATVDLKKIKKQLSLPKRDTVAGRWIFGGLQVMPPQQKNQAPMYGETAEMILNVQLNEMDPAASTISVAAARDGVAKRSLKLVSANDNRLAFECLDADGKTKAFEFAGQLVKGQIVGAISVPSGEVLAMRLTATDERTFARIPEFRPFEEQHDFVSLVQSAVPEEDIKELAKNYPASPMLKVAFIGIIEQMMQRNASDEDISKLIALMNASLKDWGAQARAASMMEIMSRLILSNYETDRVAKWVDETAAAFEAAELKTELVNRRIDSLREMVELRRAIQALDTKSPEKRDEGRKIAEGLLKKNQFQLGLLWKLAEAAREDKRTDEALKWYSQIAVFPLQEALLKGQWARDRSGIQNISPTERVAQLWKEKTGGSEGLDQFLNKVYREELLAFAGEPVTKRANENSNRVALMELFTGARCEQCVCADVALAGIEKIYPQSMVVTLRYHQHIPGHDPLATEDGEARLYNFYRGQGTPTMELNGHDVLQTGGMLGRMFDVIPALKKAIETELEKTTDFKIELTAKREGDDIKINAAVTGDGLDKGKKRLRIVLAESEIDFTAANGVRRHDMVVRQMLAGEEGVAVADGKLVYEGQTNVAKVKAAQLKYLEDFASNQRVEFPVKPAEFKKLSIVAWVQDDATREVLQAAVAPVE